jgi:hypothetical protein
VADGGVWLAVVVCGWCVEFSNVNINNRFVRFALDPSLQLIAVGNKHGRLWVWNVDGTPAAPLVSCQFF